MKYYLGEIFVTHRRVLFWWIPNIDRYTSVLIEAKSWYEANEKCGNWADKKMAHLTNQYKYKFFTTSPI
jgi:hypothetical protein